MSQVQILSITGQMVNLSAEKLPAALAHCDRQIAAYNNYIRYAVQTHQTQKYIDGLRAKVAALVAMRESITAAMGE